MKAVILTGGLGTRMRPLTDQWPKSLLPIGGRPLLAFLLEYLRGHGVTDVYMNLHWRGELIEGSIGDGSDFGIRAHYLRESELSGTAGPIRKLARELQDDHFVVLNGDNLTDLDVSELIAFHKAADAELTIALHEEDALDLPAKSVVETSAEGRITRFVEKPAASELFSSWSSAGVYVFDPLVIASIPADTPYDIGHDLVPDMLSEGSRVYGFKSHFYLVDIGTPEAYARVQEDMMAGKIA